MEKQLKSIKFPGLEDTYVVPEGVQIDATLQVSGKAADAKTVGDALAEKQPKGNYLTSIPSEYVTESELEAKKYLTSFTETDPTVPAWAKAASKPAYTKSEVGLGNVDNVKQYSAENPPPYPVTSVNGKTGAVTIDAVPTSRTVNGKALSSNITLSASDVGADAKGTASSAVSTHNANTEAHNDIRLLITNLTTRLNTLANSDDTTLDQMSEVVAYIKNNKSLIDGITTNKVNVSDIINNLTTNVSNKPLSAAQGVAIKKLIDALQEELDSHTHDASDITSGTLSSDRLPTVPISKGGTGATTSRGAEYQILGDMTKASTAVSDSTLMIYKTSSPSETTGVTRYRTAADLWTYINGKGSSVYGSKADLTSHTGNTTVHITAAERTNWNAAKTHADSTHAPSNAEPNQNAFSNIKVGSTTIAADSKTDTLTLVAGSNVTLTPDASNDKITIAAKDTTYSAATTSANGLMTSDMVTKLNGIATGANKTTVDSALSSTSTNPVQNKIIKAALDKQADEIKKFDAMAAAKNYSVVGGSNQPENPTENMIWIQTETEEIGKVYFSSVQPSNCADNDIWIYTGTSSAVAFDAIKVGNDAMNTVYPTSAKQYISGAWVDKTAKSWQGGKWVEWCLFLYDKGDMRTDFTGGWQTKGAGVAITNTPSFETDGIVISVSRPYDTDHRSTVAGTVKAIDLTDIKTLKVTVSEYSGMANTVRFGVYPAGGGVGSPASYVVINVSGEHSLNVGNLSGNYHVFFGGCSRWPGDRYEVNVRAKMTKCTAW